MTIIQTPFSDATKARRTHYKLSSSSPIPDSQIRSIVEQAALDVPSAFNTQGTRLVLLLNDDHKKLWDLALETLEARVKDGLLDQAVFEGQSKPKILGFKAGYGTVSGGFFSPYLYLPIYLALCISLTGFFYSNMWNRFSFSRILPTSPLSKRNSLLSKINSLYGLIMPMACTNITVCSPSFLYIFLLTPSMYVYGLTSPCTLYSLGRPPISRSRRQPATLQPNHRQAREWDLVDPRGVAACCPARFWHSRGWNIPKVIEAAWRIGQGFWSKLVNERIQRTRN